MVIRRRFLILAVATYAVGAAVVIASPWHAHRTPTQAVADAAAAGEADRGTEPPRPPIAAGVPQPSLPILPVVTVRPDDGNASARALRSNVKAQAPLFDAARAASGSLLSNGALRMPYYSFGRTLHREVRE